MLCFGLVLLVATSALAAPSNDGAGYDLVELDQVWLDEVGFARNVGNSQWTDIDTTLVDEGGITTNILTAKANIRDLAALKDRSSNMLALGLTIGTSMALATGIPGDACVSANLINEWAEAKASGNYQNVRPALYNFIDLIANNLGLILRVKNNPEEARYSVGPQHGCLGGGRSYAFEPAWESILSTASPYNSGLLEEQYCASKRLYNSFNVLDNNVGAVNIAFSLPPVQEALNYAYEPLVKYMIAVAYNGDSASAMPGAQRSLKKAVREVKLTK